jgi:hypothetical protein
MSWTDIFPVLDDDMLAAYSKHISWPTESGGAPVEGFC